MCVNGRMWGHGRGEVGGRRDEDADHKRSREILWRSLDFIFRAMGCHGWVLSRERCGTVSPLRASY